MTALDRIQTIMREWPAIHGDGQRIIVPTHCLYPSNGVVAVTVEGGANEFRAHDAGGAIDEFLASGASSLGSFGAIRHIAKQQGLRVTEQGVIQAPLVRLEQVPAAVVVVANASKEIAHFLTDRYRPQIKRDIREVIRQILDKQFYGSWHKENVIAGKSNKQHRFDFVVKLPQSKLILIDAVVPEASSINSAVVANLDVRAAELLNIEQRIVYDDDAPWKASDLALLAVGAKTIPLSTASHVLRRLAA